MLENGVVIDGKYKIIKEIGRGGMGRVYLAEHQLLGQKWAIKEIDKEKKNNGEIVYQSLLVETNILKKLNHPNLPRIIDVIQTKETVLLVMEYIEGNTLEEIIHIWGPQPEKKVIKWSIELCEVLSYLHTRTPPIIYCDLKPSNILVKPNGKIVLIDFGTAREYWDDDASDMIFLGSERYAAPEQFQGRKMVSERTDIYSLGLVMCALLMGTTEPKKICGKNLSEESKSEITPVLQQIIVTCTKEDPMERYADGFALKFALFRLEKEKSKKEVGKVKKEILFRNLFISFLICGCIFYGVEHFVDKVRYDRAISYVNQAERAVEREVSIDNYKLALQIDPGEKQIYTSMTEYFIIPNHFSIGQAATMMNLLESDRKGKNVLSIFRKKDPEGYSMFCYDVGIGYFYHMGGVVGKKEAGIWFRNVVEINCTAFDEEKRRRAELYEKISNYYDTFIENGEDISGEQKQEGYEEFFFTLKKLNQIKIGEKSTESDVAAAYLISKEIAIEIGNYALEFLTEEKISGCLLMKELQVIDGQKETEKDRVDFLSQFLEREEIEELKQFVEEAKKKVILAEQIQKQGEES